VAPAVALKLLTVYHLMYMEHAERVVYERQQEVELAGEPLKIISPYAEIGHRDLIDAFYAEEDPAVGRELSVRLLAHAGFQGDATTEPLRHANGEQIRDPETGDPLTLADYVNYAAEHHLFALPGILSFLRTTPGDDNYRSGRLTTLSMARISTDSEG
jgi:hypothetical protein